MKISATGVAGFIGFHLAERLLRNGAKVIGINNALSILEKLFKKKLGINI